jgi:hypothetical protein
VAGAGCGGGGRAAGAGHGGKVTSKAVKEVHKCDA